MVTINAKLFVLLLLPISIFVTAAAAPPERSFKVDYGNHVFLKDGQPFRYISGEMHYFRIIPHPIPSPFQIHPSLWSDRLYRVRAAGLNAIQVYIPWNFHEPTPGSFNFAEDRDIVRFLRIAQQNELNVLIRLGPYVCAELEFGGMPWWLVKDQADIVLRTSNAKYQSYVKRYFSVLLALLKPLLYEYGGPILMLQIENEYGSALCDHNHTRWLRDFVRAELGQNVVLYTTDGPSDGMLRCGSVEDTLATVDFGPPQSELAVKAHFALQRKYSKGGPPVNSEFYTTWFSMWGDRGVPTQRVAPVIAAMDHMWKQNASFNFYMIHGGTSFGFWSGRENSGPVVTSYDYAAPISEAGQITPLYQAISEWIAQKPMWPNPPLALPKNRTGVFIDRILGVRLANFIAALNASSPSRQCIHSSDGPLNFEAFQRDHGLMWYSTVLEAEGAVLSAPGMNDHAYVFVDAKFQGNLTECNGIECARTLRLRGGRASKGQRLDILVESIGRLTYPLTKVDPKGILSAVFLDGKSVGNRWVQCGVDLSSVFAHAQQQLEEPAERCPEDEAEELEGPALFAAKFTTGGVDWAQLHTFFDSRGWGHGLALVNNFNLGRYWPLLGPQLSLFVPGAVMQHENTVVLVELSGRVKSDANIHFVANPVYTQRRQTAQTGHPMHHHGRHNERRGHHHRQQSSFAFYEGGFM